MPKAQKQKAAAREKDVRAVCQQEGCMGAAAGGRHRGRQRGILGPGHIQAQVVAAVTHFLLQLVLW